ncbi:MAG: hypothetical protein AMXMBFR76_05930 [Pseudomonadota bacterium]
MRAKDEHDMARGQQKTTAALGYEAQIWTTAGWGSTASIVLRPKFSLPQEFAPRFCRGHESRAFATPSMIDSSRHQRVPAESLSHDLLAVPLENDTKPFGN